MCSQSKNINPEQSNLSECQKYGYILNRMAAWILFLCVACAVASVGFFAFGKAVLNEEKEVNITYVFQTDTTGVVTPASRALADSVLYEMSKYEHRIADKYEYIIEQRSNIEDYLTWGGILLTVIVSIFGFFGYKSLHDIQEKIVKQVEPSARKAAEDKAEEVCGNKYQAYETTANSKIKAWKTMVNADIESQRTITEATLKENIKESINARSAKQMRNQEDLIKLKVQEMYNQAFAGKVQDIENNAVTIDNLQKEIAELMRRIDELAEQRNTGKRKPRPAKKERISLRSVDPDPMNPKNS